MGGQSARDVRQRRLGIGFGGRGQVDTAGAIDLQIDQPGRNPAFLDDDVAR